MKFENGLTGYKELYDVVDAHNKFVDANPDYFPNDIEIVLVMDIQMLFRQVFIIKICYMMLAYWGDLTRQNFSICL